jgi:hypothetical protein
METGVVGQHAEPKPLRPSIPVNEGMTRIDLVHIPRGFLGKVSFAAANEVAVADKVLE